MKSFKIGELRGFGAAKNPTFEAFWVYTQTISKIGLGIKTKKDCLYDDFMAFQ